MMAVTLSIMCIPSTKWLLEKAVTKIGAVGISESAGGGLRNSSEITDIFYVK